MTDLRNALESYCAEIGSNSMLIQGAGGNVSWKDDDTIFIKASGTWLSQALDKDIFVPLSLSKTRTLIQEGATNYQEAVLGGHSLKPSIETALHALLDHKIVVHVHAIDVIAHAVQRDSKKILNKKLVDIEWAWVPYAKPGPELAHALQRSLIEHPNAKVFVLANHGAVIAADTIADVSALLRGVCTLLECRPRSTTRAAHIKELEKIIEQHPSYELPATDALHELALDDTNLTVAKSHWVMYPDHAVFLGQEAVLYNKDSAPKHTPCLLIPGKGLLLKKGLNQNTQDMLLCYLEVVRRIHNPEVVMSLNLQQIGEILNWDAEKYRQDIAQ